MWLANTAIKKPVFATMLILSLVTLGVVSYPGIGVDLYPKVDFPIVNITTTLRGASPEIMDIDVTDKIEEAVGTINGVKRIYSTSTAGVSNVIVEFALERDIDIAVQEVIEQISVIRGQLPKDIDEPVIRKVDPDAAPIMWLSLSGEKSARELSAYADEVLDEQLQRIEGVGSVMTGGLRSRQIRVWLDADKLRAYGLSAHDVSRALQRENLELPGGRIESKTKEYIVKIQGEITDVQGFNNLIVSYQGGAPIRLRDIGSVEDGMEEKRSIIRFNGLPAVGLGIQKQSGTNTVEVINRIEKELVNIRNNLPPGMNLDISFDQSVFIERSINEVQYQLIYGGFLAAFVVFIFLRNIRSTVIVALSIPISLISTLILINTFNFTFNNMTMLGLAIAIGTLIDNAIVVIENINRHIENGMPPREAASFATSEIGLAVMASTFTTVVIFLPVAFMKGLIGMFFLEFGLVIVFAVLVSLFVAFTFTPMMASRYLRMQKTDDRQQTTDDRKKKNSLMRRCSVRFGNFYSRMENAYKTLLAAALRHKITVIIIAITAFISGLIFSSFLGKEFVPPEDQGTFIVRLEAPIGYSVEQTDSLFRNAEEIVRATHGVKTVFYAQGIWGETNKGIMFINLTPGPERQKSQQQIMAEIRKELEQIPGLKGTAEDVSLIGGGMRMVPIEYSIKGPDMSALESYAEEITSQFSKIHGVVDVETSHEAGKPELRVYIDRDRAADLGVDAATLTEVITLLISGEVNVTNFKDEDRGKRYDVRMKLNPEDRQNPEDISKLYVRSKDGRLVELSNIVSIHKAGGPAAISRVDRQRSITIFANLENKPLGEAKAELDRISDAILPPGYSGIHVGIADVMGEAFFYLSFALILGIIMVYIVLASQFESFVHPFTILLSVPLSLVGVFSALLLTGSTLNIFSFIGIILLVGIVVNNGILLISYINTLRERGMERKEAILNAGPVRLRPMLMTTLSLVFAMIPIALGIGEGAEIRSPMAIAVIGGLLSSLLLTLIVVPVVYELLDDLQNKLKIKSAVRSL
jgi:HAE1 family hydrophobic/amphiphilic exporter-1